VAAQQYKDREGLGRSQFWLRLRDDLKGYSFIAPWLIGFFVLTFGPMLISFYYSLTSFDLLRAPRWVGAANYIRIFTNDPKFLASLKVTFTYVLISVPLKLAVSLSVAILLDRGLRGLSIYRSIFYLPSLLGGSVAIAVLWQQLFQRDGMVNAILHMFGVQGPSWISNPSTSLYTLITLSVWQFGTPMIIFLAGLRQIPKDVYEAAEIDGAKPWRRFYKITLPLLSPVIFFNAVVQLIDAFKAFTPAFIISGGTGGPIDSTLFYTLYLYNEAFGNFRMGYASALAWILLLIIAIATALSFVSSKYWVHYDD
jgi:multiple sugar transport system permease protein